MMPMMQVTGGIADFQVLARDDHNQAVARASGRCYPSRGIIEARLCDRGAPVAGLDWRPAGKAKAGEWSAHLPGLPTGGPYDLELRLLATDGEPVACAAVRGVLVGDLWLLGGQSNMQGCGLAPEPPAPLATVNMLTVDDRWALALEPLHPLLEAVDDAYWKPWLSEGQTREPMLPAWRLAIRAPNAGNMGPGLPFAHELYRLTQVPIGLIPCALGGSSLEQWNPNRKDEGGQSLYGAMIRRAAAAGGNVRGLAWYQGESDALTDGPLGAPTYQQRFAEFASALRRDLGKPDLCVLYVQIGRFKPASDYTGATNWDQVREAQRRGEPDLGRAAVVPAHDAGLEDLIHIDGPGQELIGRRLARQAARECYGRTEYRRGPRLAEVTLDKGRATVSVRFTDVNGCLRAKGRPVGFAITDAAGSELPAIRRVDLPADCPDTARLRLAMELPEGALLWYARGVDPYANLTDDQDSGLLAFGPVAIPFPPQ